MGIKWLKQDRGMTGEKGIGEGDGVGWGGVRQCGGGIGVVEWRGQRSEVK